MLVHVSEAAHPRRGQVQRQLLRALAAKTLLVAICVVAIGVLVGAIFLDLADRVTRLFYLTFQYAITSCLSTC